MRYFWQGNHQVYGHIRLCAYLQFRPYTVMCIFAVPPIYGYVHICSSAHIRLCAYLQFRPYTAHICSSGLIRCIFAVLANPSHEGSCRLRCPAWEIVANFHIAMRVYTQEGPQPAECHTNLTAMVTTSCQLTTHHSFVTTQTQYRPRQLQLLDFLPPKFLQSS